MFHPPLVLHLASSKSIAGETQTKVHMKINKRIKIIDNLDNKPNLPINNNGIKVIVLAQLYYLRRIEQSTQTARIRHTNTILN